MAPILNVPWTVVAGAALVCAAFGALLWGFSGTTNRSFRGRVGDAASDLRARQLAEGAGDRLLGPAVDRLGSRFRRLTPAGAISELERRLMLAGRPKRDVERTLAGKAVGLVVGILVALMTAPSMSGPMFLVCLLGPPAFGFMFVDLRLKSAAAARQYEIQIALASALDQITISVEAGLGFDAALLRYSQSASGPLADELSRTLQDVRLGSTRREAFSMLLDRTDSPDLRQFVLALTQGERHGLPLAQILRTQAKELRAKRRERAEKKAAAIPVKVVFPMVICILPVLFIVILGPAAFRIMDTL